MGADLIERPWLTHYEAGIPRTISYPDAPLYQFLTDSARRFPDRAALHFYGRQLSYRRLNELTDRFAEALIGLGVRKGDRVALMLPNVPQSVIGYFGILKAGAYVVPINPLYVSGVILLLSGFWWMQPWLMAAGGSLVVLAVIHYTVILGISQARAATRPLTVPFLAASVTALCMVVILGLTMALILHYGFLGAALQQVLLVHLVLGILGWLSNTLIGVSYTLVSMFALVVNDVRSEQVWPSDVSTCPPI